MLILKDFFTRENVEFENSTGLIDFLKMQNPTVLRSYKKQFEDIKPDLKIEGIGSNIRICKR